MARPATGENSLGQFEEPRPLGEIAGIGGKLRSESMNLEPPPDAARISSTHVRLSVPSIPCTAS
jgi:hypothetical protein